MITPVRTTNMEQICHAFNVSPKANPMKTATIGIKYVTELAKRADEKAMIRLNKTTARAVPTIDKIIMYKIP